jgi:hypothetical protein
MANVSLPRPDLEAHRNSLMLPMPELLRTLVSKISKKLTTYVAGVNDARTIESWMAGEPSPSDAERGSSPRVLAVQCSFCDNPFGGHRNPWNSHCPNAVAARPFRMRSEASSGNVHGRLRPRSHALKSQVICCDGLLLTCILPRMHGLG